MMAGMLGQLPFSRYVRNIITRSDFHITGELDGSNNGCGFVATQVPGKGLWKLQRSYASAAIVAETQRACNHQLLPSPLEAKLHRLMELLIRAFAIILDLFLPFAGLAPTAMIKYMC